MQTKLYNNFNDLFFYGGYIMIYKRKFIYAVIAAAMSGILVFSGCSQNNSEQNPAVETESSDTADNIEKVSSSQENEETQSSVIEQSEPDEDENKPLPEISDPTPDNEGEYSNGVFIYNNVAYEPFYGETAAAKAYAETISYVKNKLGNNIKLYNVVAPTHTGVDLPDKFKNLFSSQEDYLNTIVNSYTADVIGVNAYNKIAHHRNEYLYFNSDHHWTALGAYYAYRSFTSAAGIKPVELSDLKSDTIEDYIGSFEYFSGRDDLKTDYVTYYYPDYDIDCLCYDEYCNNPEDYMLLHTYASGSNSYGVFLGGDQPIIVAQNPNGNGKKIAVLKESYGNAFSPFICYTYSETHIIDFRYAQIDLKKYLQDHEITDVIIINNSMASATEARLDDLKAIVDSSSEETFSSESYDDDDDNDPDTDTSESYYDDNDDTDNDYYDDDSYEEYNDDYEDYDNYTDEYEEYDEYGEYDEYE